MTWLNGGYYYRGMIYCGGEAIGALVKHLGGPPLPPQRDPDPEWGPVSLTGEPWTPYYHEADMQPLFEYIEGNQPAKKTSGYSGEDWPQPIGTWDSIAYAHNAENRDTGEVTIPDADDSRRKADLCPCMLTRDGSQSPDCTLPNYRKPFR